MARLRSVNRTAEAIALSQPATSAALARLRTLFDDALFVRAGAQMEPTPRALELAPAVHRVVYAIQTEILQESGFEAARADRSFTILTPTSARWCSCRGVTQALACGAWAAETHDGYGHRRYIAGALRYCTE